MLLRMKFIRNSYRVFHLGRKTDVRYSQTSMERLGKAQHYWWARDQGQVAIALTLQNEVY